MLEKDGARAIFDVLQLDVFRYLELVTDKAALAVFVALSALSVALVVFALFWLEATSVGGLLDAWLILGSRGIAADQLLRVR